MENFVDFSGTFKVASIIGIEQYCGVLGSMDLFYIIFIFETYNQLVNPFR